MRIENLEIIWGINRQKLKKNADACRIWPLLVIIPNHFQIGLNHKFNRYVRDTLVKRLRKSNIDEANAVIDVFVEAIKEALSENDEINYYSVSVGL